MTEQPTTTQPTPTTDPNNTEDWSFGPPLKERAWALYCQGYHTPSIGRQIGVPERTVRNWITKQLTILDEANTKLRHQRFLMAIHRQRAIVMAAWKGYERALALEESSNASAVTAGDDDPTAMRAERAARQALAAGARYLAVIATAEREIARLQNLYDGNGERASEPQLSLRIIRDPGPPYISPTLLAQAQNESTESTQSTEDAAADDDAEDPADATYVDTHTTHGHPNTAPTNENQAKSANTTSHNAAPAPQGPLPRTEGNTNDNNDNNDNNENAAKSATVASPTSGPSAGNGEENAPFRIPKRREIHFGLPVANYYGGFGYRM